MTRFASCLVALAVLASSSADAQSPTVDTGTATIVTTAPRPSASKQLMLEKDLDAANTRVRRTRNALFGTTGGFVAGLALGIAGASQCQIINTPQNDQLLCNQAGDILLPTGFTILSLSTIGMITSGIMLGVAKKRQREAEREYRNAVYGRRLEWDPRGVLRF